MMYPLEKIKKTIHDRIREIQEKTNPDIDLYESRADLAKAKDDEGVSKMVGDFNIPSDLKILTEYQCKVDKSENNLLKRFVYSPNISMDLTIDDTGEKGINQVKDEMNHFSGVIFEDNKNDLVTKFMRDVTRN